MPFARFRSRFRPRFEDDGDAWEAAAPRTRTLPTDNPLNDIADANFSNSKFGTVRVKCWPSIESDDPGRRWGKYGALNAVVMPFRTKAYLSTTLIRLSTYEIEMFLCNNESDNSGLLSFSTSCRLGQHGQPCLVHSDVSLVELPAPEDMVGGPQGRIREDQTKSWRFRSEVGCSCGNSERAAKWVWTANGHDPVALYSGLAIKHPGSPFRIACRIRGSASIQDSSLRLFSILKFDNEKTNLRWWVVEPEHSDEDISRNVKQLDRRIRELNSMSVRRPSPAPNTGPVAHALPVTDRLHGQNYATTSIGGSANVVVGNVTYMNSTDPRVSQTTSEQSSARNTALVMPGSTAI